MKKACGNFIQKITNVTENRDLFKYKRVKGNS